MVVGRGLAFGSVHDGRELGRRVFGKLLDDMDNRFAGNEFEVSVSIGGICKHITDIHELEDMFTQADKIMYASKLERHKNRK